MAKTPRCLNVEQVAWAASAMKTRDLPKRAMRALFLKLDLLATVGSSGAMTREQLANAISNLEIVLNGQDHIISIPFFHLFFMNWYDFSKEPPYSIDTSTGASRVEQLSLMLPFCLTRAVRPQDTILDLRSISTASLQTTFGAAALSATVTVTSGNLRVETDEYVGVAKSELLGRHELSYQKFPLSATGELSFDLDVKGSNQYRRLFLYTRTSAGALANTEISRIKIEASAQNLFDRDSTFLQDWNAQQYSIAACPGVYVIDFTRDGLMSQRLNAQALNELTLKVICAASGGSLEVVSEKAVYKAAVAAQVA